MSQKFGKPVAIDHTPDSDGSHVIFVEIPEVGRVPIRFAEKDIAHFVTTMQKGFLERYEQLRVEPQFPLFEVTDAGVGHGEAQTGIWVATAQSGVWGLHGTREVLTKLKEQIDRAIKLMDARSKSAN